MQRDTIVQGDCLELLPTLHDHSVDMILCDLPYGKTAAKWDVILPMDKLWQQYKRLIKPHGAIVLTAVQPFTSLLVTSNLKWYRHSWVWDKGSGIGLTAKMRPIQQHEDILIFANNSVAYYPVMHRFYQRTRSGKPRSDLYGELPDLGTRIYNAAYPTSILRIPQDRADHIHPTQKPVALFDYLIRTYTKEGDTVLDHCSGSGTTAIAAYLSNRHFLCIEKDSVYWQKSNERLARERAKIRAWEIPGMTMIAE